MDIEVCYKCNRATCIKERLYNVVTLLKNSLWRKYIKYVMINVRVCLIVCDVNVRKVRGLNLKKTLYLF